MPAFEAVPGMPYWIDVMTSDSARSAEFYRQVFGWDIAEVTSDYSVARVQGLPVAGFVEQPSGSTQADTWVTYFLAHNLDAVVEKVVELGGKILSPPSSVHFGQMVLAVDCSGALFGLFEPANAERFVAAGEPGTPVWHELSAVAEYSSAVDFYRQLFDWSTAEVDEYTTALIDGAAFAGIANAAGQFPAQVPSFWRSFIGVANVDETVAKVKEFGGEVIIEPQDPGFGKLALIADATGATVTICEVPEPPEEGSESDDLLGIDLSQFK